ncbi:MAG: KpsF/GutQ family sugar-phosphate isomerase [Planctomycetes bacterium]|nr:KpsF/GutQ family sugar-phosphate isomerase [Planctomycetota bacterium]
MMEQERSALQASCERLIPQQGSVEHACRILAGCGNGGSRRVVVSGVGKAGLIARKVAATLCSTGTAATYIHPVEGLHGDVGFVRRDDAALLFSYSGETIEVIRLALQLDELGCEMIAVTRSQQSSLAGITAVSVTTGDVEEACYLGLAPSSSTTVMLAIGDALALTVARHNGFREEDFARNHPAGSLGLKFRRVESAMRTEDRMVLVSQSMPVREVVEMVSKAKTGAAVLANEDGTLCGIFTDGDLRRALLQGGSVLERDVLQFSSHPCHSISSDATLAEAMNLFAQTKTEDLPVVDRSSGCVVGLLCLKDVSMF